MRYFADYDYYDENYLNDLVLNFKYPDSKIFLTLIPNEILKAKDLNGLVKDEVYEQIKFLKENGIMPYLSLNFDDGSFTGIPRIEYLGPKKMMNPIEEPFRSCVEPTAFLGKKWHTINLSEFQNSSRFRNNVKLFIEKGYTASSCYFELYENGVEIANVYGYLGKIKINSSKVLEGIIRRPTGNLKG
jgi:hypothetical protein